MLHCMQKIKNRFKITLKAVNCTQRRNRTGTVSYRCLRPTRLPVPPAGLNYFDSSNLAKYFKKYQADRFKIINFQTILTHN